MANCFVLPSIENSASWNIPNYKCSSRHNSLVPTIAQERKPWCGSLLSVPLCVWSTCDPGSFNTPGISNGSTMVCYGRGLRCYLHAICQDETCWDRTKTQKKRPQCRDQHSNLYVICPQSASTSPPWQLLIISTLPPPHSAGFSGCVMQIQTSRNALD